MARINFYLKDVKSKSETAINLHCNTSQLRFKYYTGEKINVKQWNFETQRGRKSYAGSSELNLCLNNLEEKLKAVLRHSQSEGASLSNEYLKEQLVKALNKGTIRDKGFFGHFEDYIALKSEVLSPNYIKKVRSLIRHLKEFEREKKYKLSFSKIDLLFYDHFKSYLLKEKNLLNNSSGSYFSILKTFLNWATSRKMNQNLAFRQKEFQASKGKSDHVSLSNEELLRLMEMNLPIGTRLYNVREAFCFACCTGLRFSDIGKVKKESYKDGSILLVSTKTKDRLAIPINRYALAILERNDFQLPVISNQKTNVYIKELAEKAAINDPVIITKLKGTKEIEEQREKFNYVTTHTARRTFITLSLEKGMRPEVIMEITGHKDYKTFKHYIKITDKVKETEMSKAWNNNLLRAI